MTEFQVNIINMDRSNATGLTELLDVRVPRSYKGTLTQMFGTIVMTAALSTGHQFQIALIPQTRDQITIPDWGEVIRARPVWLDAMALRSIGTPADDQQAMPKIHVDIDFRRRSGRVQITNLGTRSNLTAGWTLIGESDSTMTSIGGLIINSELEWLGGHGGGNALMFSDEFFMDQEDSNND